jgi:hypothetical protein
MGERIEGVDANGTVLAQTQSKRFWHSGCYHSWRIGRSLLFDAGS